MPSALPTVRPTKAPKPTPTKMPTPAPSAMPTTAAPSTFVPTDMPLVSAPPTATPLPSPAPTATAAPTTTPTLACDSATSWVASEDLACEDACAARGVYTNDAIRASAWDQVDTLPDLFQVVYGAMGVECSYVNSQIVDEEAAPYVVETGSADAPYVCYGKERGAPYGDDPPPKTA